jgi:hypothetical protein
VNVSWHHLARGERAVLEQRFRLSEGVPGEGERWTYVLTDTRPALLEQLLHHPKVAFADGIDRRTFHVAAGGPLTGRRGGLLAGVSPYAPRVMKLLAYGLGFAGVVVIALGAAAGSGRLRPDAVRDRWAAWLRDPRGWLLAAARSAVRAGARGIPVASPQSAAVFRIVFGALVLTYVLRNPVYPELLTSNDVGGAGGIFGSLVRALAGHPGMVDSLPFWLMGSGALFIAGAGTTISYAAFVAAFMAWASVQSVNTTQHLVSALGIALICLLPARWSDAWSVDAWLARRHEPRLRSRRYGYAMWVPVFVLGLTLAMAAMSKLRGGFDWILNGTVRYHFVTDLDHALVPWGVWLTRYQPVAILMSAAAVAAEVLVITAAFSKSDRYRALMGASAACLLAGFALFQGVIWPGWWLLLLGFLPWHRIARRVAAVGDESPALPQRAVVCGVAVVQVGVWIAQVEARPVLSAYDMYSVTYDSDEAYEAARALTYRVVAMTADGSRTELCSIDYDAARALTSVEDVSTAERERVRSLVDPCLGGGRRPVVLEGYRQVFNWQASRFEPKRQPGEIGPLSVDWLWDGP